MKQKIIIFKNISDLHKFCANQFIKQVIKMPNSKIGFATGVSPIETYKLIVNDYINNKTSWENVKCFNLDEFIGIDKHHSESFISQMQNNLFNKINVQPDNINIPNCSTKNPKKEALRYEKLLRANAPIDFQYISLGINGHMAYNEPGTPLNSLTHIAKLTNETILDIVNKGKFSSIDKIPKYAITMGIKTLLETTSKIMMVSYGVHKAEVTRAMLEEKPNKNITASALQNHKNCFYVLDEAAASKLSKKTLENAEYK